MARERETAAGPVCIITAASGQARTLQSTTMKFRTDEQPQGNFDIRRGVVHWEKLQRVDD